MPPGWDLGVLGVKNFSVGFRDSVPSFARSSIVFEIIACVTLCQRYSCDWNRLT